jgi:hypothetical protein
VPEADIILAADADAAVKAAIKAMEITDADRIRRLAARPADDTMTGCGSIYRLEAKA